MARKIQTNDMSIRIRFDFLASRKFFGFSVALRKFVSFGFTGGCAPTNHPLDDSPEGPIDLVKGNLCQGESFLDTCCTNVTERWFNG